LRRIAARHDSNQLSRASRARAARRQPILAAGLKQAQLGEQEREFDAGISAHTTTS
jgi:hypothetical protein